MGTVIAMAHCPFHDDRTPSLAIYEDSYHCFGCKKTGKIEPWMSELIHGVDTRDKSHPKLDVTKYSYELSDNVKKFFEDRQIPEYATINYLVKGKGDVVVLPCYDVDMQLTGHQKRNVVRKSKNKYITIPVNGVYPDYSWCPLQEHAPLTETIGARHRVVVIVESIVDGLFVNRVGFDALALLGTSPRGSLIPLLASHGLSCIIFFDPDAIVVASYLNDKLNAHGINSVVLDSDVKPYECDRGTIYRTIQKLNKELQKNDI